MDRRLPGSPRKWCFTARMRSMLTFASLALPFHSRQRSRSTSSTITAFGRALRTIGRQASGNLRQVLQPHGDMKPVEYRKPLNASVEKNAPQPHLVAWIGRLASGAGRRRKAAPSLTLGIPAVPFKAKAACRRHIPKQQHRVTNWAAYDAALRQRGSLIVWFTPEAVAAWAAAPRTSRGGQPSYSDLAITTALTLRAVFRLALRQTEGLIGSILQLLDLDLAVPDHSTLSRRAETLKLPKPRSGLGCGPVHLLVDSTGLKLCGPGEWLTEKHGTKRRRAWRVLHLATDADTGRIVASVLTDKDADDGSQVGTLLDHVDGPVASVIGNGAYDRDDVYAKVAARHPEAAVVVPPRTNAVPSEAAEIAPTPRDRHLRCIAQRGRLGWQRASGYNWRALVECDISRWKRVIGNGLRS